MEALLELVKKIKLLEKSVLLVCIPLVLDTSENPVFGIFEELSGKIRKKTKGALNAGNFVLNSIKTAVDMAMRNQSDLLLLVDDWNVPRDKLEVFYKNNFLPKSIQKILPEKITIITPPEILAGNNALFSERKIFIQGLNICALNGHCAVEWTQLLVWLDSRYNHLVSFIPKPCINGIYVSTEIAKDIEHLEIKVSCIFGDCKTKNLSLMEF